MAEAKIKKAWYKKWWAILLFIFIALGIFSAFIPSDKGTNAPSAETATTGSSNTQPPTDTLITKSLDDMFPSRGEIPTEFTIDSLQDLDIKVIPSSVGLESAKLMAISKLEGTYGLIGVNIDIYKFSSIENAKLYYDTFVNGVKQEGGYTEINMPTTKATCFGYELDYGIQAKFVTGVCRNKNIFFMVEGTSSNTLKSSESYMKDIVRNIDKRLE